MQGVEKWNLFKVFTWKYTTSQSESYYVLQMHSDNQKFGKWILTTFQIATKQFLTPKDVQCIFLKKFQFSVFYYVAY